MSRLPYAPTICGMEAYTTIYSIFEAARELGLSAEWLRVGERRGSLPYTKRDRNNYRYYTPEDIERLRNRRLWEVVSRPRITSSPPSDTTPERTRDARARAWAYVFKCFYCRAGKENTPDDHEQFVNKERRTT